MPRQINNGKLAAHRFVLAGPANSIDAGTKGWGCSRLLIYRELHAQRERTVKAQTSSHIQGSSNEGERRQMLLLEPCSVLALRLWSDAPLRPHLPRVITAIREPSVCRARFLKENHLCSSASDADAGWCQHAGSRANADNYDSYLDPRSMSSTRAAPGSVHGIISAFVSTFCRSATALCRQGSEPRG